MWSSFTHIHSHLFLTRAIASVSRAEINNLSAYMDNSSENPVVVKCIALIKVFLDLFRVGCI